MVYKVKPIHDCKACHGTGMLSGDWVDYGSTRTQLPSMLCDCIEEQLPEWFDDSKDSVEIDVDDYFESNDDDLNLDDDYCGE